MAGDIGIHIFCCTLKQVLYVSSLWLLKLPLTSLEWTSSFFGLSLPSKHMDQFQIIPGMLPRSLQNYNYPPILFCEMKTLMLLVILGLKYSLNNALTYPFGESQNGNSWQGVILPFPHSALRNKYVSASNFGWVICLHKKGKPNFWFEKPS